MNSAGTLFAGTTGTINGTVTDSKTSLPIAGVVVSAVSPSANLNGKTDAKGFYSFSGVSPDTYAVSFEFPGFQPASTTGVNVFQDVTATVNSTLTKSLSTIGRVTARSVSGAFQPGQTQDTISIGTAQIEAINGREFNTNESNLLTSLPGASLDSSGYPVLRGGRENEEGYNFEGISIVDSFTNQFQNSLSVNGIANFQLTPGAGNATVGNAGTGTINYTAKRGTYPGFGSLELETQSSPFTHQLTAEYGFSTPNGNISNYVSFIGQRAGSQIGPRGTSAVDIGQFNGGLSDFSENNIVDNFIYKFGSNKNYELQLLYQNQIDKFGFNYGGTENLRQELGDPYFQSGNSYPSFYSFLGFTNTEIAGAFSPLPGQGRIDGFLSTNSQYQPNALYKVQLSHNFDPSTFLRLAYYGVDAVQIFDLPDPNIFGAYLLQGSTRSGFSADLTKQFNSKNLVQIGAKFEYQHPIDFIDSYDNAAIAVGLGAQTFGVGRAKGFEFADFLSPTDANCNGILTNVFGATSTCGYLAQFFGGTTPKIPNYVRSAQFDRGDISAYINDQFQATSKLKIEAGVRLDGNATHYPATFDGEKTNVPNNAAHPLIPEPRLAASFTATKRDSFRASFARSIQYAPLLDVARTIDRSVFNPYNNIPSYDVLSGPFDPNNPSATAASVCGSKQKSLCPNYGEQLFAEYQYGVVGSPIQPVKPETFTSYDFTYSHDFGGGVGARVTPFYTRGYDIIDRVASVTGFNPVSNKPILGPAVATNLGIERTTGVEFQLTREARYGFSGQVSATYINKLSNVPPLAASEDFFPTIPSASLALGSIYRVGYLSPFQATAAIQYKTRGGLRINPQITYNKGYPQNQGLLFPTFVNGVATTVPITDVTGPGVGRNPTQFVDPANPGTVFNPNVLAKLGTPESASPGGILSNARFNTNLTVELSPPNSKSTIGVQIFNLFNQLYNRPNLNTALQPVANGVLGPQTGLLPSYAYPFAKQVPYLAPTPVSQFGNSPYTIFQGNTPTSFLFYFQQKL